MRGWRGRKWEKTRIYRQKMMVKQIKMRRRMMIEVPLWHCSNRDFLLARRLFAGYISRSDLCDQIRTLSTHTYIAYGPLRVTKAIFSEIFNDYQLDAHSDNMCSSMPG